jgi:hypothetical protein
MRKEGFYWVKFQGEWVVAEYIGDSKWWLPGAIEYLGTWFDEIDETKLERGN